MRRATCFAAVAGALIASTFSVSSAQNERRQKKWQRLAQPNENHEGKDHYIVEMFQTGAGGAESKVLELEGKRAS